MATDFTYLNCHNACPNCLLSYQLGNESPFSLCSCEELQRAHVEEANNVLLGYTPASLPCLGFLDDLSVSGALGFPPDATGTEYLFNPAPYTEGALAERV